MQVERTSQYHSPPLSKNMAKICFCTSISTQALIDLNQKLFHQIYNDNIYYVFTERIFDLEKT